MVSYVYTAMAKCCAENCVPKLPVLAVARCY